MSARRQKFYAELCRVCLLPQGFISVKSLIGDENSNSEVSCKTSSFFNKFLNKVDINGNEVSFNEMVCQKDSERMQSAVNLIEKLFEFEDFYFKAVRDGFHSDLNEEGSHGFNVCRACLSPEPVVQLVKMTEENLNFPVAFGLEAFTKCGNSEESLMCEKCLKDFEAAYDLIADLKLSTKVYYDSRNNEEKIGALIDRVGNLEVREKKKIRARKGTKASSVNPGKLGKEPELNREDEKNATTNSEFKCAICGRISMRRGDLKKHLDGVHVRIDRFSCGFCIKKFTFKNELEEHVNRNHKKKRLLFDNSRPFKCNIKGCYKFFQIKIELQRHYKTHSDDRPFVCWCKKAFKFKGQLEAHQQRHVKNGQSAELSGNSENQRQINGHPCSICGKLLSSKKFLNRHIECVHSRIKKFSCDLCQRKFTTKGSVLRHLRRSH